MDEPFVICDGNYVFRNGKPGDMPASGWANRDDVPTFVLEYEGKQIGAAHGSECYIAVIEVFRNFRCKGHGTKFVEMWEKYARIKGYVQLEISPVSNDELEHMLSNKRGFFVKEIDQYGEKTYCKKVH